MTSAADGRVGPVCHDGRWGLREVNTQSANSVNPACQIMYINSPKWYSFDTPALANVTCAGNETTIQDCSSVQPSSSGCPNRQAMTVNCKGTFCVIK